MVATVKFNAMVLQATVGALMVKEINECKLRWDLVSHQTVLKKE
jgi:hypothetical protein